MTAITNWLTGNIHELYGLNFYIVFRKHRQRKIKRYILKKFNLILLVVKQTESKNMSAAI